VDSGVQKEMVGEERSSVDSGESRARLKSAEYGKNALAVVNGVS
jgi:hypothetical protein